MKQFLSILNLMEYLWHCSIDTQAGHTNAVGQILEEWVILWRTNVVDICVEL